MAWVEGSDTALSEPTRVYSQEDLLPQFHAGNDYVYAVAIDAPNEETATAFGYKEAFFDNYTARDAVSMIMEVDHSFVLPSHVKQVKVQS
jgi:hypothetical protein